MRRPLLLLALVCLPCCKTATGPGRAKTPEATESGAFGTPIAGADDSPLDPTVTSSGAFSSANAGSSRTGRDSRTDDRQRLADLRAPVGAGSPPGSSKEHPLPTCDTNGSYGAVADAECEDGSRPFDGDLSSAKGARRGSVGADKDGHVIDLYEVPCPEGPKEIFVDMYACERAQPTRSKIERDIYVRGFLAGDHARLSERCFAEDARGPGRMSLMLQACVPTMPTALREQGKLSEAHAWLARWCAGTADERERWSYFRNVLDMLDVLREEQGRSAGDRAAERKQLAREYAKVCEVDLKAFEAWVKDNPG
ncbi:hypothetical protein [Nannocystis sp. SCPEA4]|uniref:hypothetical protein n=1 Tax=Nannocystis sp. SCPEA4 TaxID=2996787 RepID=UPI00226F7C31|nr:hypothetical protein [Nannocystis sp. SCPEA4]MCY1061569.1 hypothetical protein [Nannocystis sp. SCPEA4]